MKITEIYFGVAASRTFTPLTSTPFFIIIAVGHGRFDTRNGHCNMQSQSLTRWYITGVPVAQSPVYEVGSHSPARFSEALVYSRCIFDGSFKWPLSLGSLSISKSSHRGAHACILPSTLLTTDRSRVTSAARPWRIQRPSCC